MVRLEIIARYLYIHFVNKIVITTQVIVVFKKLYTVLYPQSCKSAEWFSFENRHGNLRSAEFLSGRGDLREMFVTTRKLA